MTEYERVREQVAQRELELHQSHYCNKYGIHRWNDLPPVMRAELLEKADGFLSLNGIEIRADDQSLPTYRGKPLIEGSNATFLIKALKLAGFIKVVPKEE